MGYMGILLKYTQIIFYLLKGGYRVSNKRGGQGVGLVCFAGMVVTGLFFFGVAPHSFAPEITC